MGERIDLNSIETEELVKVDGPVSEVEKVYKLLKRVMNSGDRDTRAHYRNLYFEVSKFFEN